MLTRLLAFTGLLCAVVSARMDLPYIAYGVVIVTIISCLLCVWDKLDKKWIPVLVFCLGLAFLFQTTLKTDNLIGTDIHTEYFIYQNALDGWDTSYPHAYNTAIGSTIIAPFLTNTFGINGFFIYKFIYPLLFAFVPLILFFIYRKEFGDKIAFLASVIFVTLPTYTLEMIGLPRQMMAELMLGLIMFLIILRPMKTVYLVLLLLACTILGMLFHYVLFPIIFGYLLGAFGILVFIRIVRRWWKSLPPVRMSLIGLAVVVIIPVIIGFTYYQNTARGGVIENFSIVFTWMGNHVNNVTQEEPTTISPGTAVTEITTSGEESYLEKHEPLIRTALGLDFMSADALGKGFRIWQFMAQLGLALGCLWLVFNYKKISAEYITFIVSSLLILAACILIPRMSNIINATRFYHIALFAVSPLMILGLSYIFRNLKLLVVIFMIPYILFMTGVMFEITQETDTGKITAPYSIALSNHRLGMVGEYSSDDKAVMDYIIDNKLEPVLTDVNSMLLMSQRAEPYEFIHRSPSHNKYYTVYPVHEGFGDPGQLPSELHKGWGYLPKDVNELPDGTYIFLTGYSMRNRLLTFKPNWYNMTDSASGLRVNYPFEFVNLENYSVVYQAGDAALLRIRRED